ncbi:flagellar hook-length control protein FliK [Rhizobium alvei]|uniref:Flagellar hook-length control protein FliK n=1 Tax=Rhizobium alvei TaxID=1132659 RepID=A0ABT8YH30_9HYPH|nr:flagellar hook-length control protein FliK [Rhizobium alvei]MDO6962574.1 flagellar hook-length control protein FliK [Rhizobium alvei]
MIEQNAITTAVPARSAPLQNKDQGSKKSRDDAAADEQDSFENLVNKATGSEPHGDRHADAASSKEVDAASDGASVGETQVEANAQPKSRISNRIAILAALQTSGQVLRNAGEAAGNPVADGKIGSKDATTKTGAKHTKADGESKSAKDAAISGESPADLLKRLLAGDKDDKTVGEQSTEKTKTVDVTKSDGEPVEAAVKGQGTNEAVMSELASALGMNEKKAEAGTADASDGKADKSSKAGVSAVAAKTAVDDTAVAMPSDKTDAKDPVDLAFNGDLPANSRIETADADQRLTLVKTEGNANTSDSIAVLEARRYLGFTTDVNANALAQAAKSDVSWNQALSALTSDNPFDRQTVQEVNTLKLQMNPGDLGNMVASLSLKGDELTVQVQVETVEAYRQLSGDKDSILQALKDQGFSIDSVTVQLSQSAQNDADQSQDGRSQLGQDRQGQGEQSRERDASYARQSTSQDDEATRNTPSSPVGSDRSGRVDSSDIYL